MTFKIAAYLAIATYVLMVVGLAWGVWYCVAAVLEAL